MKKFDWRRHGVEHLERFGCIINIREGLSDSEDRDVTAVEIIPDPGWILDGNRVIRGTEEDKRKQRVESWRNG